jgi:demethylmenaquinone methyltransferase/2-methoxy-6-polyprenyl-1,4-benzoquinol methylase
MQLPRPLAEASVRDPHPVLSEYYSSTEGKQRFVQRLFDASAGDYDRVDRVLAFGTGSRYRREALRRAGLAPGMRMLDVAVGTGLVAKEAAHIVGDVGRVTGVDPSPGMMSGAAAGRLALVRGRAEALPFTADSFDFVALGFALRHLVDLEQVFLEFRRVLKPGGRLLVLEITRPEGRIATALLRTYLRGIVPFIARLVGRGEYTPMLYRYYWDTIEACAPPDRVMATMAAAGFGRISNHRQLGILSEYCASA